MVHSRFKFPTKLSTFFLFLILLAYFVTRLCNLSIIPIFTDEAIYIRWSQTGSFDPQWRFIPLVDGKPPLYHWFVMVTVRIFSDPLIAGRIVSVASGFISLILIGILAYYLFRRYSVAAISMLFYVFSPFMLVYDRLAIVDSMLTSFSIASFLLAVWLIRSLRLDSALLLGASIGAGMLTKTSGLLFLVFSPATFLINNWKKKEFFHKLFKWLSLLAVSTAVSQLVYSILRLSQFFYRIQQKNQEFLISFSDFFQFPFSLTWGNAKSLFRWQVGYLTLPIVVLTIFAFSSKKQLREKLLLLCYYLAPFFLISTFNKIIFPRFLLFSTPFLLVLAAFGLVLVLDKVHKKVIKLFFIFITILIPAITCYNWITAPAQANIPQSDRDQYWDSWPAGHGIQETVSFLKKQAELEPIFVGTQGTFGLFPYSLEIYLVNNPNVEIKAFWPVSTIPEEVIQKAATKPTYFIYNELEDIPPQPNLQLILEFEKHRGDETRHMRLFQVNPL